MLFFRIITLHIYCMAWTCWVKLNSHDGSKSCLRVFLGHARGSLFQEPKYLEVQLRQLINFGSGTCVSFLLTKVVFSYTASLQRRLICSSMTYLLPITASFLRTFGARSRSWPQLRFTCGLRLRISLPIDAVITYPSSYFANCQATGFSDF